MMKRTPGGAPDGGEFASNEHDEAPSSLPHPAEGVADDDREYHEANQALNRAAYSGAEGAVGQRREVIEHYRDSRGYDSINFETNHIPRSVTTEQALSELTDDLAEARRNGAFDPDYEYGVEQFGSEVHIRMRSLVGRKPQRSHLANSTWMRLEARADSYRKNGVNITLPPDKPWRVV